MSADAHCTPEPRAVPEFPPQLVSIFVAHNHPVLQLKRALDWPAIQAVMVRHWRAAGKNVEGRPGLPWPVSLYVPLLVLMAVKALNSRQMEEYLAENGVARVFVDLPNQRAPQIRDHANIARAQAALGTEGWKAVNHLIVGEAVRLGFGRPEVLSSDTTVQEPQIGYPHEAGILGGIAQRVARSLGKLQKRGWTEVVAALAKAKEVLQSVKHYHLFTKTKPEKDQGLRQIVAQTQELIGLSQQVIDGADRPATPVVRAAGQKIRALAEVTRQLVPQILQWLQTGVVARGKILHAGITTARAIVKNKVGKKVEFGLKWLLNRLDGGYVFGTVVAAHADERKMPVVALQHYREVFGPQATPEMLVYDRGGSAAKTVQKLHQAGVKKVGIAPVGQAPWSIAEADRQEVKRQRAKSEGSIGALKSQKYAFNHGRQRTDQSLIAAGQWALVCLNLNTLTRALSRKQVTSSQAAA